MPDLFRFETRNGVGPRSSSTRSANACVVMTSNFLARTALRGFIRAMIESSSMIPSLASLSHMAIVMMSSSRCSREARTRQATGHLDHFSGGRSLRLDTSSSPSFRVSLVLDKGMKALLKRILRILWNRCGNSTCGSLMMLSQRLVSKVFAE